MSKIWLLILCVILRRSLVFPKLSESLEKVVELRLEQLPKPSQKADLFRVEDVQNLIQKTHLVEAHSLLKCQIAEGVSAGGKEVRRVDLQRRRADGVFPQKVFLETLDQSDLLPCTFHVVPGSLQQLAQFFEPRNPLEQESRGQPETALQRRNWRVAGVALDDVLLELLRTPEQQLEDVPRSPQVPLRVAHLFEVPNLLFQRTQLGLELPQLLVLLIARPSLRNLESWFLTRYKADTFPNKVNLGVGAYRTDDGKPYILNIVRKV